MNGTTNIVNGIRGRLVSDGSPIVIPFNAKQMQLATNKDVDSNWAWDCVCDICVSNDYIDPRGNIHIDFIIINGKDNVFH